MGADRRGLAGERGSGAGRPSASRRLGSSACRMRPRRSWPTSSGFTTILLWIITAITAFVLVAARDHRGALQRAAPIRRRRAPRTTRCSRSLWTIVPVVILLFIAVPSFRLLFLAARRAEGRPHHEGDRQAVVLELQLSRQRQVRVRIRSSSRRRISSPTSRACSPSTTRWWCRSTRSCTCWSPAPT